MNERPPSENVQATPRKRSGSRVFPQFDQWTVRARIASTFAVVVSLVLVQAAFSIDTLRRGRADATLLRDKSMPALTSIAHLERDSSEQQIAVLRMLLSKPSDDLTPFSTILRKGRAAIDREFHEYEGDIVHAEDRVLFEALVKGHTVYRETADAVIALIKEGKREEAVALNVHRLRPAYVAYHESMDKLVEFNVVQGQEIAAQIQLGASRAYWITVIASSLVLIVSVVLGTLIVVALNRTLKRVAQRLSESSEQVAAASAQVSASSQSLAEGTSEQAASIEETSSSMEEMASMTKRNSDGATRANELARQARESADAGAHDMETMKVAMEQIRSSSDDIAKIVKTIDEIAFQTNILALNAAVEAARAGTAGAGFAVVADEVRALAQRSAQAAKETSGKIEGAIHRTKEGVEISEKVASNLGMIVERVRQVDELVREVTTACSEQSDGIQQINTAVTEMDKVVQAATGNAEETAAAAEELSAQAVVMRESVQDLTRLLTGSGSVKGPSDLEPPDESGKQAAFLPSLATRRPAPPRSTRVLK